MTQAERAHVVNYSGGIVAWATAKLVAQEHGTERLTLLFADTRIEDCDSYRFLRESAANVGGKLVEIADGRTPWEVFRDRRFIGNSRVDPCSKILKRELLDRWHKEHCDPANTVIYVGLDWSEVNRFERFRDRMKPWHVEAPLIGKLLVKRDLLAWARKEGLEPPRLYAMGFPHANCGGFCVKAGQAQFATLLRVLPERYKEHEEQERQMQEVVGKDRTILKDRRGGTTKPMSLREFRERLERQPQAFDEHEWGGCGCAVESV